MPFRVLFDKVSVSPRVSFWIAVVSLVLVLLNNHIYLKSVQDRETLAETKYKDYEKKVEALIEQERKLKIWEMQLDMRENEIRKLLSDSAARRRIEGQ